MCIKAPSDYSYLYAFSSMINRQHDIQAATNRLEYMNNAGRITMKNTLHRIGSVVPLYAGFDAHGIVYLFTYQPGIQSPNPFFQQAQTIYILYRIFLNC